MTATPASPAAPAPGPEAAPPPRGLRAARAAARGVLPAAASRVVPGEPDQFVAWVRASRMGRFLRSTGVEGVVRRVQHFDARRQTLIDALPAVALFVLGAPHHPFTEEAGRARPPIFWLVALAMLGPLAFRRRAPFAVFLTVAAGAWLEYLSGRAVPVENMALLLALYTVASRCSLGRILVAVGVMEFGVGLVAHGWATSASERRAFVLLSGMVAAATVLGLNIRTRRAYLASLEERARRLEFERDQQAEIAAAAERASIAREVHDIVTHSLSVMVALTDGASFAVHSAPDQAADALGKASDVGRQAIGDMQRVLGILRSRKSDDEGPELQPQPGLSQLDGLLAEVRAAGLPVELVVGGAVPELSSGAGLAVYRVVQEALTNTRKHAGAGATARVELRVGDAAVDVTVVDDGGAAAEWSRRPARLELAAGAGAAANGADGGGHGIAGMRERAAVYGGVIEAGPRSGAAGWRVHARFPQQPDAAGSLA